jgi:hypothetical protein
MLSSRDINAHKKIVYKIIQDNNYGHPILCIEQIKKIVDEFEYDLDLLLPRGWFKNMEYAVRHKIFVDFFKENELESEPKLTHLQKKLIKKGEDIELHSKNSIDLLNSILKADRLMEYINDKANRSESRPEVIKYVNTYFEDTTYLETNIKKIVYSLRNDTRPDNLSVAYLNGLMGGNFLEGVDTREEFDLRKHILNHYKEEAKRGLNAMYDLKKNINHANEIVTNYMFGGTTYY